MPRVLSRGRKIAFSVVLIIVVLALIEGLSQWTYRTLYDHHYHPRRLAKLTSESWVHGGEETGVPGFMADLIVHPYFGFGADAVGRGKEGFGFLQQASPLDSKQQSDKLRVLVLGGSVAAQLMERDPTSPEARLSFLEQGLRKALEQKGIESEPWLFHGAMPGSKQPQQFLAYSFLMSLGAEFDLIVNLDGFNEMTLAMYEGRPKGLHPAYPRGWEIMLGNRLTAGKLRRIAQLLRVRQQQADLIAWARSNRLARPTLVGLFLAHKIVANERQAQDLVVAIEQQKQQGELALEEGGVPFDYSDDEHAYRYLATLWRRSSTMLQRLAQANNSEYLHLFQPNQYLEGSKVLSQTEREKYYLPDQFFGAVYREAYPYFLDEMSALAESGEWFVDASMIYKDVPETVYADGCCHFNAHGLRILAGFIGNEIADSLNPK